MEYRSVEEYLRLPYTIEIVHDEGDFGEGWFARVIELPGCMTQADNMAELESMIQDAMRGWIETAIEDGEPVPEPRKEENYSGKFIIRLPRSLHKDLVNTAEHEGVSLNTLITTVLSQALGTRYAIAEKRSAYHTRSDNVQQNTDR